MKSKIFMVVLSVVFVASLAIAGCAKPTPTPTPTPAPEQEVTTWRFQTIFSPGQSDYDTSQRACDDIYTASGGRLKIDLYPNGSFAGSMEAFQSCGEGVFEVHESWPVYIRGVDFGFQAIGSGNMDMDGLDKWVWLYEAGGWDVVSKAFEDINLQFICDEEWGSEVMNSNIPIHKLDDLKGLKFRTSDPRLCEEHGISAITLPLEEVFTGLATGAVDVVEFGHLKYNVDLGLTDITEYGIYPDWWNVQNLTAVVVNLDAWNALPEDLQKIVEMCFKARAIEHYTKSQYTSALAMKKMVDDGTMEFIRIPPEEFASMRADMYKIELEDIAEYGGLTKEVYDSFYEFREIWFPYKDMSKWWGYGLTPEEQMGYTPEK